MSGGDIEKQLLAQVVEAKKSSTPLAIYGGGSKSFYGREIVGEQLHIAPHSGVIDYHPTELVITARAGTPITEIIALLDRHNQILGFEPPIFSRQTTLGGAVAAGLSGSARPFVGPVNHFVLGIKVLTGHGEVLKFGGQVIKNVAGFDVSRLLVGSMGCLGVLLEISLKVIPKPQTEITLLIEQSSADESIQLMNGFAGKPLPITAAAWVEGQTRIRISGNAVGVKAAQQVVKGEIDPNGIDFWTNVNNQSHRFFNSNKMLIRGSVPPATKFYCTKRPQLIDWGGGLRWINCDEFDGEFEEYTNSLGGHVSYFRNADRKGDIFAQLSHGLMTLNRNLKNQFDPDRILNPGRMYAEL